MHPSNTSNDRSVFFRLMFSVLTDALQLVLSQIFLDLERDALIDLARDATATVLRETDHDPQLIDRALVQFGYLPPSDTLPPLDESEQNEVFIALGSVIANTLPLMLYGSTFLHPSAVAELTWNFLTLAAPDFGISNEALAQFLVDVAEYKTDAEKSSFIQAVEEVLQTGPSSDGDGAT